MSIEYKPWEGDKNGVCWYLLVATPEFLEAALRHLSASGNAVGPRHVG